jgi:hypothetical protein
MKTFEQYLVEQGLFQRIKGFFTGNDTNQDPNMPRNGDKLTIFYLYQGNGAWLLSDTSEGTLRIDKNGAVFLQYEMGNTNKLANNIQQLQLLPNGPRSWKINHYMK